jgi:hypothetical protein
MAYLTATQFRDGTLAESCHGLALSLTEAPTMELADAITRLSVRLDDWTNDHFESEMLTLGLDGRGGGNLLLPKRCTAVTQVDIRNSSGALTTQDVARYRLHSSLEGGTRRKDDATDDWLELVPGSGGLTGLPAGWTDVYLWPLGLLTVDVTGAFGWTAVPGDIKRALALLVWDHFKALRQDLRRTSRYSTAEMTVDPADASPSGILEVDAIIAAYRREPSPAIAVA